MSTANSKYSPTVALVTAGFVLSLLTGCSIKKIAINSVANSLAGGGDGLVFAGENDPKLVADALPFALKMYETLAEQAPENAELRVETGKIFVMYAYAFVQVPADQLPPEEVEKQNRMKKRAKKLYLRGRRYLLEALELRHPGFRDRLNESADSALAVAEEMDSTALYWTGMAWMGAITADKFDLGLVLGMKKAVKMVRQVAEYNEAFGDGAVHEFFLSYYGGLPASMGGSEETARFHYQKAVEFSNGKKAGPYVSLATTVSVKNQDVEEYRTLLHKALDVDTRERNKHRLTNVITQQRAQWLLDNIDRYFLLDEDEGEDQ